MIHLEGHSDFDRSVGADDPSFFDVSEAALIRDSTSFSRRVYVSRASVGSDSTGGNQREFSNESMMQVKTHWTTAQFRTVSPPCTPARLSSSASSFAARLVGCFDSGGSR